MFCENCGKPLPEDGICKDCSGEVTAQAPVFSSQEPQFNDPYIPPVEAAPAAPAEDPGKGKGTASLTLGIVALVLGTICSCVLACLGGFIPLVCAIVGLVLGIQAEKISQAAGFENKNAKIGKILCIVAIAIVFVFIVINAILGGILTASGAYEEILNSLY